MIFFFRNVLLANILILFFFNYAYSEEEKIIKAITSCADYEYSKLEILEQDEKTFQNDLAYKQWRNELNLLEKKREEITEDYKKQREKFKLENPEPKMKKYSKKEWAAKTAWDKNKNEMLSSIRQDLDKVLVEMDNYTQLVDLKLNEVSLNYLKNAKIEFKINNIKGYFIIFRNCESRYNDYPISFNLKWSKNSQ
tara:strand:+ start:1870 stop:2454 length:585 start_codon:yes stop_codon:yes gene_type:complete